MFGFFVCICVLWSLTAGSRWNSGSLRFESFQFSATLKACSTAKEASPLAPPTSSDQLLPAPDSGTFGTLQLADIQPACQPPLSPN